MRLICLPLLAVLLLSPPVSAAEPRVELAPGTQAVLDFPGIRRVAVANPSVADVKVVGKSQLLIIGSQRGTTALTVWTDSGQQQRTIVVAPPRVEELARELKALGFSSLDVRAIGENVVVDGQVDSFGDLQTIRRAVDGLSYVKLLVRLDAKAVQAALAVTAEQINSALKRNGIQSATAVVVGQRIILEGSVSDEAERHKAQRIADSYYEELKGTLGPR
jgi:Flp pilus assembly secretin CpaC